MAGSARKIRFGSAGLSGEKQGKRGGQSSSRHPGRELSHSPCGTGEAPMGKPQALLSIYGVTAKGKAAKPDGNGRKQATKPGEPETPERTTTAAAKGPARAASPVKDSTFPIYHKRQQERDRKKRKPKDTNYKTGHSCGSTVKPVSF